MSNPHGFTIDGTHCNSYGVAMLEGSVRPMSARTADRYIQIAGLNGAHYFGSDYRPLEIRIECEIYGEQTTAALQTRLRALADALNGVDGKPQEVALVFDDETAKTYDAYALEKVDVKRLVADKVGQFRLTFLCFDATAYGTEETTTANITTSPGQISVENTGTAPDFPVIKITNNGAAAVYGLIVTIETEV
jgi:predicted phage tail component-like protein